MHVTPLLPIHVSASVDQWQSMNAALGAALNPPVKRMMALLDYVLTGIIAAAPCCKPIKSVMIKVLLNPVEHAVNQSKQQPLVASGAGWRRAHWQ
jgi:hypothetical protein